MEDVSKDSFQLFYSGTDTDLGVVIVNHGLNNRPEAMQALTEYLNLIGYHVIRTKFTDNSNSNAENWIEDMRSSYCYAKSAFKTKPLYNISYVSGQLAVL